MSSQPLLLDEPRDHADDRPRERVVTHRQPEMLEQGPLAGGLARQVARRRSAPAHMDQTPDPTSRCRCRSGCRCTGCGERTSTPSMPAPNSGVLCFPRVGRTDRRQVVAIDEAGLQEAEPPVELPGFEREHVPGQAETGNDVPGEESLVREVVNREDAAGARGAEENGPASTLSSVGASPACQSCAWTMSHDVSPVSCSANSSAATASTPNRSALSSKSRPPRAVIALAVEEPWHVHHDEPAARRQSNARETRRRERPCPGGWSASTRSRPEHVAAAISRHDQRDAGGRAGRGRPAARRSRPRVRRSSPTARPRTQS